MSTPSKALAAARRQPPIDDDDASEGSDNSCAEQALEVLQLLEKHRVNLLLMGTSEVVHQVMAGLGERMQQPVARWSPGQEFVLPPSESSGTVILNDVGALPIQEQIRLLEWLPGAHGRTQVVSTAPTLLLPRVKAGAFIDTLYYRLNTVCLDGTSS